MALLEKIKNFFKGGESPDLPVHKIYAVLVGQARKEELFERFKIRDHLDNRFDMVVLHLALFIIAVREKEGTRQEVENLCRDLVEYFLKDMDQSLREIGVGDLSVGKQVKKMASALMGRVQAYEVALGRKDQSLEKALKRNVFRGSRPDQDQVRGLAGYVRKSYIGLKKYPLAKILDGKLDQSLFPEITD